VTQDMIELGEYGGLAIPAERAEEPSRPSTRRSRRANPGWLAHRRRLVHRATAPLLVVVCLLGLSASANADPGLDRPHWAIQQIANGFGIGRDNVYLVETGGGQVTARDLDTGEVRWRIHPIETAVSVADMGHGVVGIHTHARIVSGLASSSGIVLVSEPWGEVLLEYTDLRPTATIDDRLILISNQPAIRGDCADDAPVCTDMVAFDLRAGREAWRVSVPLESFVAHVAHPLDRLAIRLPSGQLAVFNAATGAITDTISPSSASGDVWADAAAVVGDVVVTAVRGYASGEAEIVGYRLDPLRRIWSVVMPVGPITDFTGDFAFTGCGPLLCLRVDGGNTLIDPNSGLVGPHLRVDILAQLGGGGLIAVPRPLPGQPTTRDTVYRLDATGIARTTYLDATVVTWPDASGRALIMRTGEHRTAFTIVDRDGRDFALGSVAATSLNCAARETTLVCYEPGGRLRAWRLPS
jgi:hypothetical protein